MILFFSELSFNNIVLFMFLLRLLIVLFNISFLIKIIGFKNLKFLQKYINPSAINTKKLYTWIIAILSFAYIEYIMINSKDISMYYVLNEYLILGLIVLTGLISIIVYAIIDTRNSISEVRRQKDKIELVKLAKQGSEFVNNKLSNTEPKNNFLKLLKIGVQAGLYIADNKIDDTVQKEIKNKVDTTFRDIFINMSINIIIISIATYIVFTGSIFPEIATHINKQ